MTEEDSSAAGPVIDHGNEAVDTALAGDRRIHARMRQAVIVLHHIVDSRGKTRSVSALQEDTGLPRRTIVALCRDLQRRDVLRESDHRRGEWSLSRPACAITLEDIYLAVVAPRPLSGQRRLPWAEGSEKRNVELLLMQATLTSNQIFFKTLRQFTVDRLRMHDSVAFAYNVRARRNAHRCYS